jgi:hypothetical protein
MKHEGCYATANTTKQNVQMDTMRIADFWNNTSK